MCCRGEGAHGGRARGQAAEPRDGTPSDGTGTDCIVVAAPVEGRREQFAGKHTVCGSAIGAATFGAVSCGVARWLEENRWPVT